MNNRNSSTKTVGFYCPNLKDLITKVFHKLHLSINLSLKLLSSLLGRGGGIGGFSLLWRILTGIDFLETWTNIQPQLILTEKFYEKFLN